MNVMTIRNVPDELRENLKAEAIRNRRSVNQQVLVWLEAAWRGRSGKPGDVEAELREIRALRRGVQPMSAAAIDAAKQEGRA